jgi:thioester reductase-like protein
VNQILPRATSHRPYLFVTGVTGLLGQYLMRDLLRSGQPLAVLVRSNARTKAAGRVKAILKRFQLESNQPLPQPIVIEGDVCQPSQGLSKRQVRWIAENCSAILHNAASLQFQGDDRAGEPWCTNVDGTMRVIELARQADIGNFHYVSTAYVCGKRSTPVFESDFDCGQSFRNDYERSKYSAEQLVRSASHLQNTTIYRPVVIGGDSKTGFTSTYHGVFLYLRLMATLVPVLQRDSRGLIPTPIQLPLSGNEPRNLVTVDWVSEVMTHLIGDSLAHGRTYHLSPDHPIKTKEFFDDCCAFFHSYGVEFVGPEASRQQNSELANRFIDNAKIYEDYETSDPQFDKSNLLKFAGHIACPRIDRQVIFRFIEFGQANRWGKKPRIVPGVSPLSIHGARPSGEPSPVVLPN